MITHRNVVEAIKKYPSEMTGLVSSAHYCKTLEEAKDKIKHSQKRTIIFSLSQMDNVSDEDYDILKYDATIIDKVGVDEKEVMSSEDDNIYVTTSFLDYLNYELDDRVDITTEILNNVEEKGSIYTSINIIISVRVDKRETLWSSDGSII